MYFLKEFFILQTLESGSQNRPEDPGPTTLSRLTGISYSVVQRATSAANERLKRMQGYVAEQSEEDEEYLSYLDEGEFSQAPEY